MRTGQTLSKVSRRGRERWRATKREDGGTQKSASATTKQREKPREMASPPCATAARLRARSKGMPTLANSAATEPILTLQDGDGGDDDGRDGERRCRPALGRASKYAALCLVIAGAVITEKGSVVFVFVCDTATQCVGRQEEQAFALLAPSRSRPLRSAPRARLSDSPSDHPQVTPSCRKDGGLQRRSDHG